MKIVDILRNKYINHKFLILITNQNFYMKKFFTLLLFVAMLLPWVAQGQISPVTLPYNCGFEDSTENANWSFVSGTYTNHLVIGTAINNGGTHSLYVTNNDQNSYAYTTNSESYSVAYREIIFSATGQYNISYDWRCAGEGNWDAGYVFLAPSSASITEPTIITGNSSTPPAGWISLNGSDGKLSVNVSDNNPLMWRTNAVEELEITADTYKLVVFWENDSYGGSTPPIAIDNISIQQSLCPRPSGLQLVGISDVSATLKWNTHSSMNFTYKYDTANASTQSYTATTTDTTVTLSGLTPNTRYRFSLQAVCGENTSSWIYIEFQTSCSVLSTSDLPLTEGFETWPGNDVTNYNCFLKGNNNNTTTPSISQSYYKEGYKSMYLSATSSSSAWLILPQFSTPIDSMQLSFWAMKTTTYDYPIVVGVIPDILNPEDYDTIATMQCSGAETWEEFVLPLTNYNGRSGRLAIISPDGVSSQNYIDNVRLEVIPTCLRPLDLTAIATGYDSGKISWTSTGATTFVIEYDTAGFTLGTGIQDVVYADSIDLLYLVPNYTYDVYVRSYCSDTDLSSWVGPARFHTLCEPLSESELPFTETFDSWGDNGNDPCFTLTASDESYAPEFYEDWYNNAYVRFYDYEDVASWMALPAFEQSLNTLQITFDMTTYDPESPIVLGAMSNPNDRSTFDSITTIYYTGNDEWENISIPLSSYQGNGTHITFLSPFGTSAWSTGIDNIVVEPIPACPNPRNLAARAIDHQSAVVSWQNMSTGSMVVEYGPMGFALGQGTQLPTNADSIVITGLNALTMYSAYIRSICGEDSSQWIGPVSFRTTQGTSCTIDVTTNAYVENFNFYTDIANGSYRPNSYPNHELPSCWSILNMSQDPNDQPKVFITSFSSYAVDGNCLFLTSHPSKSVYMALPQFTSNIEALRLSFTYRNEGTSEENGTLSLGIMSNPNDTATFCLLETFAKTTSKTTIEHIFADDTITGTGYYIAFRYSGGTSNTYYYFSIDNVVVDLAPSCRKPENLSASNVTSNSAQLDWTERGNATSWIVEYGPIGFTAGTGTTVVANAKPYTLQGLNSSSEYEFYVRALCGAGDTSEHSARNRFTTSCDVITTLPWTANLDGTWVNDSPLCWNTLDSNNSLYYWTYNSDARTGSKALFFDGNYTSTFTDNNDWMITPEMQLTGNEELRFWAKAYGASYPANFRIYACNNDSETFVPISDVINITSDQYTEHIINLSSLTGNVRLAFVVKDVYCYELYIDDITVMERPLCSAPTEVAAANISSSQADLSWTGNADVYDIAYGPHGFSLDSVNTYELTNASETNITLTGLTANTLYDVYVMAHCNGSNTMSEWSNVYSFKTLCSGIDVPYSNNFNNYDNESTSIGENEPSQYPNHIMPECWIFNMSQTPGNGTRIFLSANSGYNVSGNSLFFKSSSSTAGYAVLPLFNTPIDSLLLEFSYRYESATYGKAIVGVMTDPADASTFIGLDTLRGVTGMTETSHAFWNDSISGTGYYIAIKYGDVNGGSSYYFSIDEVSVTAPTCRPSTNITATNITATSVDIIWNNASADSFVVAYSTIPNFDPAICTTTVSSNTTSATLSGLTPNTQYYYAVKDICDGSSAGWSDLKTFSTPQDCGNLTLVEGVVGNGTSTATSMPFYASSSYPSAKTWQIYTQEDLERIGIYSGNINSISLQYTSGSPMTITFKVYMSETNMSQFSSAGDSIAANQMTLVYNGTTQFSSNPEWTTIALDNAFQYSGTGNLVIAIERLSTVPASGYFKYHGESGNNTSICKYEYSSYSSASASYYRNNMMFNACTGIPACLRPSNVVASNIQTTQVDLAWTSSASEFDIAYGPTGFNINNTAAYQIAHATSNTTTLTNLMSGTKYDVYVRGICNDGADTSNWSYVSSFQTVCATVSVPYTEDFNSYSTDIATSYSAPGAYPNHTMPTCWTFANMSSVYNQSPNAFLSSSSSYVRTGNCLFFKSSSTTPLYAVLPKFDVSIDSLYISFAYRNEGVSASNGTISLGVMSDPTDPTTFVEVMSLPQVEMMTNVEHTFGTDAYTGTNYYIAFRYTGARDNYFASIEDVYVDYTPTCLKPTNLVADSIGQTFVSLEWTDLYDAGTYTVEYKRVSDSTWTTVTGISDTTTMITNLVSSTEYAFRVKAVCGANDESNFSDITYVTTLCGAVSLPFAEDFSSSNYPYNCWTKLEGDLFNNPYDDNTFSGWERTQSNNGLQGPHIKFNIGYTLKYAVVTPEIDLTNINNAELSFDLALTENYSSNPAAASSDDRFIVAISTDNGATWSENDAFIWASDTTGTYDSLYNNIPSTGVHVTLPLTQYAGNTIKIAFYGESTVRDNPNTDNDLHIDNIMVTGGVACSAPIVTVTAAATDAVLSWTSEATNFQVAYKETTATEWSTPVDVTNATSYTISGLTAETEYMARVRAICGEGDTSVWSETTFTTDQLPCMMPTNVTATDITYTSATISWSAQGNETAWEVRYTGDGTDDTIMATANNVTLEGLFAATSYNVYVRALCGEDRYSEWSEAYTFNTNACEVVSNVTATNITDSSATISWTAAEGQTKWQISYGEQGVDEENGTIILVENNPTFTIEGLEEETTYDVYVRNICGDNIYSAWSQKLQFTTQGIGIDAAANDNVSVSIYPNPANTQATVAVEGVNGKVEFVVADMNGRMIVTETIDCNGELVKTIDVSNLAKGAYFVHIYNDNINTTRKLIVK